ncbi:hypothetical protein [Fredinandcohnia sp. 179-A 10B2 NHS]|uniref:hypothetical protein n=1 Tax=Fredinandcohnia sp. 179-A 10B2 NHS TaxID=3235176 RepID=UPI0039A3BF8C
MITKKKVLWLVGIILLVGVASFMYYYYMAKPSGFLSEREMLIELNRYSLNSNATEIIEKVQIDDEHMFVPFKASDNSYGTSLWMWTQHEWKLVADSTSGGPEIWKIDSNDPSSYVLFWNIHPDDQISHGDFYAIRDRNYHITEGEHTYYPRIQMQTTISFEKTPYGIMKLPKEWSTVMEESAKLQQAIQPDGFSPNFFPVNQDVYFGWIPYNQSNEEVRAGKTHVGGGSSSVDLAYVRTLNKVDELEFINVEDDR